MDHLESYLLKKGDVIMVMDACSNVREGLNNAYRNVSATLPNDTLLSVKKSFIFSFSAVTLLSRVNIFAAAVLGGTAALVSLVDSIATGIIRQMKPLKDHLEWYENFAKIMFSVSIVNLLIAPFFGSFIVNIVASAIFIFVADIANERLGQPVPIAASQPLILF